jgi:hypothetical protein
MSSSIGSSFYKPRSTFIDDKMWGLPSDLAFSCCRQDNLAQRKREIERERERERERREREGEREREAHLCDSRPRTEERLPFSFSSVAVLETEEYSASSLRFGF